MIFRKKIPKRKRIRNKVKEIKGLPDGNNKEQQSSI